VKIEVIEPHGLCAGVNSAIAKALQLKNVYCLHELVHNEIVVRELKDLGFKFVESVNEVPVGETVVFSAHGVSPAIRKKAEERKLKIVDTTCSFVDKVHRAAAKFSAQGLPLVIIGHKGHIEVEGIAAEAKEAYVYPDLPIGAKKIGVVSQTTMNSDEVKAIVKKLERNYQIVKMAEVCKATKLRQDAVRKFCRGADRNSRAVLVLGSEGSSNVKRLCEVAEEEGVKVFRAGSVAELYAMDFSSVETLGLTSGASTPERFFDEALSVLRNRPRHIAIIMDGNGRWALARGKKRGQGHIEGAKTLSKVLKWCKDRSIRYLTVYAFSTENWKRPKEEVDGLMGLFVKMLKSKTLDFMKNKVRFRMIGRRGDLPRNLLSEINRLEEKTKNFDREFIVAISYGGRAEIIDAVNRVKGPVTEETFRNYLYAPDVPDPDLVIRTSGEVRTSNFLLWQTAYSEFYFSDVLWPDFSEAELDRAISSYAMRNRRKGGV
jgi:undecaprenyl diphosphate synthase